MISITVISKDSDPLCTSSGIIIEANGGHVCLAVVNGFEDLGFSQGDELRMSAGLTV